MHKITVTPIKILSKTVIRHAYFFGKVQQQPLT